MHDTAWAPASDRSGSPRVPWPLRTRNRHGGYPSGTSLPGRKQSHLYVVNMTVRIVKQIDRTTRRGALPARVRLFFVVRTTDLQACPACAYTPLAAAPNDSQ